MNRGQSVIAQKMSTCTAVAVQRRLTPGQWTWLWNALYAGMRPPRVQGPLNRNGLPVDFGRPKPSKGDMYMATSRVITYLETCAPCPSLLECTHPADSFERLLCVTFATVDPHPKPIYSYGNTASRTLLRLTEELLQDKIMARDEI